MAIIGRIECPLCDFEAAHVKRNDAKLPYAHCPECGMVSLQCKTKTHERMLLAKMRPVAIDQVAVPKAEPAAAPIVATSSTPAVPPMRPVPKPSFWTQMAGGKP